MRNFFLAVNIIVASLLAFCIASFWISAGQMELLVFAPLGFPYFFLANTLFAVLWPVCSKEHKKYAFFSLAVLVCALPMALATVSWQKNESTTGVKIMTWNVRNFDLYNWTNNKETRKQMMLVIDSVGADVLCFQEFYSDSGGRFDNIRSLTKRGYTHYFFHPAVRKGRHSWGVVVFSKYPLCNKQSRLFENSKNNQVIWCDVLMPGTDTLHLFNTHLQSIHFDKRDYAVIDSAIHQQAASEGNLRTLLSKYKQAALKRAQQAEWVRAEMDRFTGNRMICGDFNDVPASYVYHTIKSNMQDAFLRRGRGFGNTYVSAYPLLRIDYILCDKGIQVHSFKKKELNHSDHYPLISTFSLR